MTENEETDAVALHQREITRERERQGGRAKRRTRENKSREHEMS